MFEVVFGLSLLALTFLVTSIVAGNRYLALHHENRRLEQMNADLRYSVKHLKSENEKLRNGVYVTPDTERITALKLSLHLKQEKIDALQAKVRKQQQLLNQKWEGSKKCS